MIPTSPFGMLGVSLLIGAISIALRTWFFYAGMRAFRGGGSDRSNSQLSFDERIAERLRELEREQERPNESAAVGAPAAPPSFGRRQA